MEIALIIIGIIITFGLIGEVIERLRTVNWARFFGVLLVGGALLAAIFSFTAEGVLVIVQSFYFKELSLQDMIGLAVVLHLGTAAAALIYFSKEILRLFHSLLQWKTTNEEEKKIIQFLTIATLISGILGVILFKLVGYLDGEAAVTGKMVFGVVGVLLIATGVVQLIKKERGGKNSSSLTILDGLILGIVQGFAVLPGVSRSGSTIAAFLFLKYSNEFALKLSFLMSIPVLFGGVVFVGLSGNYLNEIALWGLLTSFVFGLVAIHILLNIAQRIQFGYFVIIFSLLTLGAVFF